MRLLAAVESRFLPSLVRGGGAVVAAGFAPGALLGAQVAGLLFFLNPDLPFSAAPLLRAIVIYASLLGGASLACHAGFTWRRPRRALRVLPWSLTAVLLAAAILDGYQASLFAFYLPAGINQRLLKAAFSLSAAGVACFYTALLHSLQHRAYGWRSRVALLLLALTSLYVMVERREAFRPLVAPARPRVLVETVARPRVAIVGIEAATLDALLPLAGQGRLPFFSTAINQGAYARLTAFTPARREALWASLATGKYPYKHGLLGPELFAADFLSPGATLKLLPRGLVFRAWGFLGHRARAGTPHRVAQSLWEILAGQGLAVGVVGWPNCNPLPEGSSYQVGEDFFAPYAQAAGALRPPELGERASRFRVQPGDVAAAAEAKFGSPIPPPILGALAADAWRESLALFLEDQNASTALTATFLPGLGPVSAEYFGGYAAVQLEGIEDADSKDAWRRLGAYYAQLDNWLSDLWRRQRGARLLVIVSAHGVEAPAGWDSLVQRLAGRRPRGGTWREAPDGMVLILGEGVRAGTILARAQIVDVVPTLLYALGLPVGRDMDGKVLTAAFSADFLARQPLTFLPSYEAGAATDR